ncbi:MAG: protein kinase domain-containing protein [Microcoleaceae cyanobacterium]
MSYCFNPRCQHPQNPGDAQLCQSCGSALVLNSLSDEYSPDFLTDASNSLDSAATPQITSQVESQDASQYRGIKLLGQGGFGRTFLVVDQVHPWQPRAVVKQLFSQEVFFQEVFSQEATGERTVDRFYQEAQQLNLLGKHPQIPTFISCFEQESYYYLVQEFIEGENLAQELSRKETFRESEIQQLLQELLPVLEFVHRHKIIHRDIKPENIIRRPVMSLGGRKSLVLVDFGAAKLVTTAQQKQVGTVIGSAAYTAPEQLMGKATFASDLYSLGVTCIHLLTGLPPFDLFDSHNGVWAWQDYLKTPISRELTQVLDQMLEHAVNRRFPSATAVLRYIRPHSKYIGMLPGLKIQKRLQQHPIQYFSGQKRIQASPQTSPQNLQIQAQLHPEQLQIATIQATLQNAILQSATLQNTTLQYVLDAYQIEVQVSQAKKNQLTIVLNRTPETTAQYRQLAQIISDQLTVLQLKAIHRVKILGRVKTQTVPEWQTVLKLDRGIQLRNYLIRLQNHPWFLDCLKLRLKLRTQEFWLSQIHRKEFWMDGLMVGMIAFIFTRSIVVFTPVLGLLVAIGFWGVKRRVSQTTDLDINVLFGTVTTLFIVLGSLNIRVWTEGSFGVILAGLFIAMPTFYGRGES